MKGFDDTIEGWLTELEAAQLDKYNVGTWIEIGCWKGRSTCVLAAKRKGIAIDWFKGNLETRDIASSTYDDFIGNTEPYSKNIKLYNMTFQEARQFIKKPVDLIFLDAEHTYESTKEGFDLYSPLLKQGGVIILHDVWSGPYLEVTRFAMELINGTEWENIDNADRSAAFRRAKK